MSDRIYTPKTKEANQTPETQVFPGGVGLQMIGSQAKRASRSEWVFY